MAGICRPQVILWEERLWSSAGYILARVSRHQSGFRCLGTYFDYDAINCIYVTSYDSETCIKVEDATDGIVPVKFLHLDNNSLPLVSDTRSYREQMERAASNPNNALNLIMREAEDIYEKFKSFPDADMTTNIFDILSI